MGVFLMYHWEAGDMARLSLVNALCAQYNVAFTILRSYLELLVRGLLFQCLAQEKLRETARQGLTTNKLSLLLEHLSQLIKEQQIQSDELENNSIRIVDLLRGHRIRDLVRLDMMSITKALTAWNMFDGLGCNPAATIYNLYGRLSQNVHESVEYTDSGRAIKAGKDLFDWPRPILPESISEFLGDFHLAMDIGTVAVLNQLFLNVPPQRFRENCRRLSNEESFRRSELRHSTNLIKFRLRTA